MDHALCFKSISKDYMAALQQHSWKGNIPEMKNIIKRSTNLFTSCELSLEFMPPGFQQPVPGKNVKPLSAQDSVVDCRFHAGSCSSCPDEVDDPAVALGNSTDLERILF